jgi:hypothetical protein
LRRHLPQRQERKPHHVAVVAVEREKRWRIEIIAITGERE